MAIADQAWFDQLLEAADKGSQEAQNLLNGLSAIIGSNETQIDEGPDLLLEEYGREQRDIERSK